MIFFHAVAIKIATAIQVAFFLIENAFATAIQFQIIFNFQIWCETKKEN